jgi:hypothetical protein
MKTLRSRMLAAVLAGLLALSFGLACKTRPVAVITSDIATPQTQADVVRAMAIQGEHLIKIIGEIEKAKRVLAQEGKIPPRFELTLTLYLQRANSAIVEFARQARAYTGADPAQRASILSLFKSAISTIVDLKEQGVFGVENNEARGVLSTILHELDNALTVTQALIGSLK